MAWEGIAIFVVLSALVTVLGFVAARWRRGDLDLLDEWGLAGRRFGTVVTWFLLGGDLYTAYTFVAVPALVLDHQLPDRVRDDAEAVAGREEPRLRDRRRLREGPLRQPAARAARRDHGDHRDDAVRRAPDLRHRRRHPPDGRERGRGARHVVPRARRLHVRERPAGPGADRIRQGLA